MTAFEHPSLQLPVTEEQRERSLAYLQGAYAEGRITLYELDDRVETVLRARTRREMNRAFDGLATIPVGTGATLLRQRTASAGSRLGAGAAHLSPLATWAIGPAVVYAASRPGGVVRREAAKAFNFQVVWMLLFASVVLLTDGWVTALLGLPLLLSWFVLTLLGGVHALAGEDWRNPLTRVVPLRLLDESPRRRELGR